MYIEIPEPLRHRIDAWERLSQWDRAELARDLRAGCGLSYGEMRRLIPVAKSTLATWCRSVSLTEAQCVGIVQRTSSRKSVPRDTQRRRRAEVAAIRAEAIESGAELAKEPLWIAGTALYWAEGAKTAPRLLLANSDPRVSRLFVSWVRRFRDPEAEFTLKLNLHADNDEPAARSWWRCALSLPDTPFYKTYVKPDGTGHRRNLLPFGVCALGMRRSADAWHRTMGWIEVLAGLGDESHC